MDQVVCNQCGENRSQFLLTARDRTSIELNNYNLVRCKTCGLVYLNPRPKSDEIKSLYSRNYHSSNEFDEPCTSPGYYDRELNAALEKARWIQNFKKGRKILDIGCGYGFLLKVMSDKGWEVFGIDPGDTTFAKQTLKQPVFSGTLEQAKLRERKFDAVHLSHVLEHLQDPSRTLKTIYGLMATDGILVVETPNFAGLDAKIFRSAWLGISAPHHLYHFSPKSLTAMLSKNRFRLEFFKTISPWAGDVRVFSESFRFALADKGIFKIAQCGSGNGAGDQRISKPASHILKAFKKLFLGFEKKVYQKVGDIAAMCGQGSYLYAVCKKKRED